MAKKVKKAAKAAPAKKSAKKATPTKMGDPTKTYQAIKDTLTIMDEDIEKFLVKEVKASARKVRMGAQTIKKLAQQLRKEIQAEVQARKNN